MGRFVEGEWQRKILGAASDDGSYKRKDSTLRDWVTHDGAPGPDGQKAVQAEADRFHLFVSYACPWAHRILIIRQLKGLQHLLRVSVVDWFLGDDGWTFNQGEDSEPDGVLGKAHLRDYYKITDDRYTGSVTVPVLWDKKEARIINNESADLLRILNTAFDNLGAKEGDYYPLALRPRIDEVNARIYSTVNNGVYKAGFAGSQVAYEKAVTELFESLDWLETILSKSEFLVGNVFTEADIRLFTTLVRFDSVYHTHFKCNIRRIVDYPNLWRFTRQIYAMEGIVDTVNMAHIKNHYFASHTSINPRAIVPVGPELSFV